MRLLRCKGEGFDLTDDFLPGKTPPYAILSHTWGNGEVTYEDLTKGNAESRPGYEKIRFCGKTAQQHGLEYFWVDTCCINKSNHSELSEAIVSMYRWYQEAVSCYVYLPDVEGNDRNKPSWEGNFRKSRWFTRGWTLQELLAPASVEFYSKAGNHLGDKTSLEKPIHEVTGIPIAALRGQHPSEFGVEERFRWTEPRTTTRDEDLAYCLFGLFDVQLPIIYGEGKDNARRRLREEIHKRTQAPDEDRPQRKKRSWIVAFERNPSFTGREPEMKKLRQMLPTKQRTTKIAITGLGGIGKTQMALEFVFQHKKEFPDCATFWIPCVSAEIIEQAYRTAARELKIPGHDDAQADVRMLLRDYWSSEESGRWLVVFDNVDDTAVWEDKTTPNPKGLTSYLPKKTSGTILFTTRDKQVATKLAMPNVINLSEMDQDSGRQLLSNYLIDRDLLQEKEDTAALLKRLTYLPLALVQAATYINMNTITIAEYLQLLDEQEDGVIELLSEDFDDDWRYENERVKNPVATTWLISFSQIQERDALASEYLSYMACMDAKDIPRALLPPGPSHKAEDEAIGTLCAYSFISKQRAGQLFNMHRLVHIATRNWLRSKQLLRKWTDEVSERLYFLLSNAEVEYRGQWRLYLPHAHHVFAMCADRYERDMLLVLMTSYAACLDKEGRLREAELLLNSILEARIRRDGVDANNTLDIKVILAIVYMHMGRWARAEDLYVEVLEWQERTLGPKHPETLDTVGDLGYLRGKRGRYTEAGKLLQRAVEGATEALGADHPDTLQHMETLCDIYIERGQLQDAEKLCSEVMEARKRILAPDSLAVAKTMLTLSSIFASQDRHDEAAELCSQALAIRTEKLGPTHLKTLGSLEMLSDLVSREDFWDRAKELREIVLKAQKTALGVDDLEILYGMCTLAQLYQNMDRLDKAEELVSFALPRLSQKVGARHPMTLSAASRLGRIYLIQTRWDKAEEIFTKLLDTHRTAPEVNFLGKLECMGSLSWAYSKLGRHAEAEALLLEAIKISSEELEPNRPDTLAYKTDLAVSCCLAYRLEEAESLGLVVLKAREEMLGPVHSDTLKTKFLLATIYRRMGRLEETASLNLEVLRAHEEMRGPDHLDTLRSKSNLASNYLEMDRLEEAESMFREISQAYEEKLGPDQPETLSNNRDLAQALKSLGRDEEAFDIMRKCAEGFKRVLGPDDQRTRHAIDIIQEWEDADEEVLEDEE